MKIGDVIVRGVRYESKAREFLEVHSARFPKLEEIVRGWAFRLARDPTKGAVHLPDTDPLQYVIRTPSLSLPGVPVLTFRYWCDDELVYIVNIRMLESK